MRSFAIAFVAGLASMFALTPVAAEAADDLAPEGTTGPAASRADTTTSTTTVETAADEAVVADFGEQKVRVGVQIADGSWVPAGTSTATSTFTITETGPNVDDDDESQAVTSRTYTCTTSAPVAANIEPGAPTASFCTDGEPDPPADITASGAVASGVATGGFTINPDASELRGSDFFRARAGSTITIRQDTAGANLARTSAVATIEPCTLAEDDGNEGNNFGFCPGSYGSENTRLSTVLFRNVGLPPIATNDVRTTAMNTPIDIEVLTNDDTVNGAPLTNLVAVTVPANGTTAIKGAIGGTETGAASVRAAATGPVITYTPRTGFSGTDTFTYTLSTPNGTATATVTITIPSAAVPADPADPSDDPSDPTDDTGAGSGPLPDVGGFDPLLLAYGTSLIAGGGLVVAGSRRRPRGAHVLGA